MLSKLETLPSYDNADQGFLNSYFPKWHQISHNYNALQNHYLTDSNAWEMKKIKIIHYVKYKPWQTDIAPEVLNSVNILHSYWWKYYDKLKEIELDKKFS